MAHVSPLWKIWRRSPRSIIDDLGMRKLPPTAAEELLEIVMRLYEPRLPAEHDIET